MLQSRLPEKEMKALIILTNLRGNEFVLNCDLIEMVSANPDTTISLTNGTTVIVRESKEEVIQRTIEYKRHIYQYPLGE